MPETPSPDVIEIGPLAPFVGGVIYHVTLESGAIVTSPMGFPQDPEPTAVPRAIIASDGRVLVAPSPDPIEEPETDRLGTLTGGAFGVPDDDTSNQSSLDRLGALIQHVVTVPKEEADAS